MRSCFRSISILVLLTFPSWISGCTTTKQRYSINTAADLNGIILDSHKKYDVRFIGGEKRRVKGDQLQIKDDRLGIRYNGEEDFRYYRYSQIEQISERGISAGKTAGLVGGLVGGLLALSFGVWYSIASNND